MKRLPASHSPMREGGGVVGGFANNTQQLSSANEKGLRTETAPDRISNV